MAYDDTFPFMIVKVLKNVNKENIFYNNKMTFLSSNNCNQIDNLDTF